MSVIGTGIEAYISITTNIVPATKEIKVVPGTAYTLEAADANKILHFTNNANIKLFIPAGLPVGYRYEGKQLGSGLVYFEAAIGSGVIVRTHTLEEAMTADGSINAVFAIDNLALNEYLVYGRLNLL